jgi:hypothetical protein
MNSHGHLLRLMRIFMKYIDASILTRFSAYRLHLIIRGLEVFIGNGPSLATKTVRYDAILKAV